jgi:hypothetical protein
VRRRPVVERHGNCQVLVLEAHDREPGRAGGVRRAIRAAERLVDEVDQRFALARVGEHGGERLGRVAEPAWVRVAVGSEQPDRGGEVAEDAEVVGRDAHSRPPRRIGPRETVAEPVNR